MQDETKKGNPYETFLHPTLGEVMFHTVFFSIEDSAILFTCSFERSEPDEKYVGFMCEDFLYKEERLKSYYFVGAAENEIKFCQSKMGKLRELCENRPAIWLSFIGNDLNKFELHKSVCPIYLPTERASLK